MINDVLPHEYAHAIIFMINKKSLKKEGHSKQWSDICKKIGGIKCQRFVNTNDIVIYKRDIIL